MIDQFDHAALLCSGGKDSLAVTYLLRPHWNKITFYHLDSGDLLPEIREVVDHVEKMVPRFVRIGSDSDSWMKENGYPSDLVPTSCTTLGLQIGMSRQ